jgi:hypothetical protein
MHYGCGRVTFSVLRSPGWAILADVLLSSTCCSAFRITDSSAEQSFSHHCVHYWITAKLNTHTRTITGLEALAYANNSPNTLQIVYSREYLRGLCTSGECHQEKNSVRLNCRSRSPSEKEKPRSEFQTGAFVIRAIRDHLISTIRFVSTLPAALKV